MAAASGTWDRTPARGGAGGRSACRRCSCRGRDRRVYASRARTGPRARGGRGRRRDRLGGPVNDVILAVVAGALRSFLISRGRHTEGVELRALVPVSVRTEGEHHQGGN